MKHRLLSLTTALLTLVCIGAGAKKVHTLGDSTMASYDESATETRGWGMYFGQYLTDGWTSVNHAKGGRDSRAGYSELWQNAKDSVEAGDYVLIQFGHNDEKLNGVDRDEYYECLTAQGKTDEAAALDKRGTTPWDTYKKWLTMIVDEVRQRGATPILVSPVCRCYFADGKVTRAGCHDLGDKFSRLLSDGIAEKQQIPADDHTMDYVFHMQQLATEKKVDFIDMTTATREVYEHYGQAKCKATLFNEGDNTHYNATGAQLAARLCALLLKEKGILAGSIVVPAGQPL